MRSLFYFMTIYDDKWFEIWYSEGSEVLPTYLLIVTTNSNKSGEILVIDPSKNNAVVFRGKNYEDVCSWLWEDDFHLVEGRVFPDDGW